MPESGPRLVLADGDVLGLLACAAVAASEPDGSEPDGLSVVWSASGPHGLGDLGPEAAMRQAEVLGLRFLADDPDGGCAVRRSDAGAENGGGIGITLTLLEAARRGAEAGCTSVLWPVGAGPPEADGGPDLVRVAAVIERAELVTKLVRLDLCARTPFSIEVPYADLTDRQIADLVLDMDLPIWLCWWAGAVQGPLAGQAAAHRSHWTAMLNAAGWRGRLPSADFQSEIVTRHPGAAAKPR